MALWWHKLTLGVVITEGDITRKAKEMGFQGDIDAFIKRYAVDVCVAMENAAMNLIGDRMKKEMGYEDLNVVEAE